MDKKNIIVATILAVLLVLLIISLVTTGNRENIPNNNNNTENNNNNNNNNTGNNNNTNVTVTDIDSFILKYSNDKDKTKEDLDNMTIDLEKIKQDNFKVISKTSTFVDNAYTITYKLDLDADYNINRINIWSFQTMGTLLLSAKNLEKVSIIVYNKNETESIYSHNFTKTSLSTLLNKSIKELDIKKDIFNMK